VKSAVARGSIAGWLGFWLHPESGKEEMESFREKIIPREALSDFREQHSSDTLVFTNGCFDIIHAGHVVLLSKAKALGDILVVGLNSDGSVRRLKGSARPLMSEEDRALILLSLKPVDFVTIFDKDTPLETIEALKPDILVKGAEYGKDEIVGAKFVESIGGKVVRIEMLEGHSTSAIIKRIRDGLDKPG